MFYQQYLTILPEGIFMLALCFVPTFIVCYLLLGLDMRSGLLNLLSIIMILVDTIGLMAMWGISYNAVSLINLVTVTCCTWAPGGLWRGCVGNPASLPPLPILQSSTFSAEVPSLPTGSGHVRGVRVPYHSLFCC